MPTYVYKFVDTGETIEVQQAFTDPTLSELAHPTDGTVRPVKKVFLPVGITFKGSGFYKTDSRGGKSATSPGTAAASNGSSSSESSSSSSSPSTESTSSSSSSSSTPAPASSSSSGGSAPAST